MKQAKINEIFYSIQGEGFFTGSPAVFVRFSGCNLRCPFCDTKHNEGVVVKQDVIIDEVCKYPTKLVILTGGEPSLFIDYDFIDELHKAGKFVAVETNGTHPVPFGVDWITCSPKDNYVDNATIVLKSVNEIKVVYTGNEDVDKYLDMIDASYHYLQPCDTGREGENKRIIDAVVEKCKQNPAWSISLQTQKILNVR